MKTNILATLAASILIASVSVQAYASCKGKAIYIKSNVDSRVEMSMDEGYEKYLDEDIDVTLKAGKSNDDHKFNGPKGRDKGKYTIKVTYNGTTCKYKGEISNTKITNVCQNKKRSSTCGDKGSDTPYVLVQSWGQSNFTVDVAPPQVGGPA